MDWNWERPWGWADSTQTGWCTKPCRAICWSAHENKHQDARSLSHFQYETRFQHLIGERRAFSSNTYNRKFLHPVLSKWHYHRYFDCGGLTMTGNLFRAVPVRPDTFLLQKVLELWYWCQSQQILNLNAFIDSDIWKLWTWFTGYWRGATLTQRHQWTTVLPHGCRIQS